MTDVQPILAPQPADEEDANDPSETTTPPEAVPPAPITEQEVGEYREQDRFLPVSTLPLATTHPHSPLHRSPMSLAS